MARIKATRFRRVMPPVFSKRRRGVRPIPLRFASSLAEIAASHPQQLAQATPPLQGTPAPADSNKAPADSKPGGERPTTPAPEPARPDAKAQQEGAKPALPPAPAEKTAPPIKEK